MGAHLSKNTDLAYNHRRGVWTLTQLGQEQGEVQSTELIARARSLISRVSSKRSNFLADFERATLSSVAQVRAAPVTLTTALNSLQIDSTSTDIREAIRSRWTDLATSHLELNIDIVATAASASLTNRARAILIRLFSQRAKDSASTPLTLADIVNAAHSDPDTLLSITNGEIALLPENDELREANTVAAKSSGSGKPAFSLAQVRRNHRIVRVATLYQELGTLQKVADKLGVTRERIRQILARGVREQIVSLPQKASPLDDLDQEELRILLRDAGSLKRIAENTSSTAGSVVDAFTRANISVEEIDKIRKESRRDKATKEYLELVSRLGHHPTTTEMQSEHKSRALYARIERQWGSIRAFRESNEIHYPARTLDITDSVELRRPSTHRLRLSSKRESRLGIIAELIASAGNDGMSASRIARLTKISEVTVKSYLNLLMNSGKIIQTERRLFKLLDPDQPHERQQHSDDPANDFAKQ